MLTLLVLNIPPELEEDLVDYLLSLASVSGFTSYETRGHGDDLIMSVAEQVSGRRKRMQFEILLEQTEVQDLLDGLVANVGRDITYWEQQVRNVGQIE
jgi:hypothetical protein